MSLRIPASLVIFFSKKIILSQVVVAHSFNPNIREAEVGSIRWISVKGGQPPFYTVSFKPVRACLKKEKSTYVSTDHGMGDNLCPDPRNPSYNVTRGTLSIP